MGTLTSAQNALRVTAIGPASASADGGEIFYTAGIMNGSDTQRALFIDVTNAASHSSTGNVLSGVYVDGITTRANVTQYGLYVGSGWDFGLFANGRTQLQAGNLATGQYGLYLSAEGPAGGSATANQIEFTAGAMDGSDAQQGIYVSVLNADHEGASNTLSGVYINELDMADDEATEYGMYLDSNNWDYGLYIAGGAGMDVLYVAGTANFTGNVDAESGLDVTGKLDVAAGTIASTLEGVYVSGTGTANVSSELIQLDHTMGNMNGGDTQKSLYINITDGTYSTIGSPNYVYGIDIDKSAAPDIDAFEYGINIGNGWDTGVNVAIGNAGSRGFNAGITGAYTSINTIITRITTGSYRKVSGVIISGIAGSSDQRINPVIRSGAAGSDLEMSCLVGGRRGNHGINTVVIRRITIGGCEITGVSSITVGGSTVDTIGIISVSRITGGLSINGVIITGNRTTSVKEAAPAIRSSRRLARCIFRNRH